MGLEMRAVNVYAYRTTQTQVSLTLSGDPHVPN